MVQVAITVGLCIGYFMCYGTVKVASSFSWRFPFAIQAGIALLLAVVAEIYLPESPRWLTYRDCPEEARLAWEILGVSEADREGELPRILAIAADVQSSSLRNCTHHRFQGASNLKRLFTSDARKPMLLGVFLMSMQQLSGIDGVLYVGPFLRSLVVKLWTSVVH